MHFDIGENKVFSNKIITNSLGKDFTLLTMLTDLLINQPANPYNLSRELEVLYRNMLK